MIIDFKQIQQQKEPIAPFNRLQEIAFNLTTNYQRNSGTKHLILAGQLTDDILEYMQENNIPIDNQDSEIYSLNMNLPTGFQHLGKLSVSPTKLSLMQNYVLEGKICGAFYAIRDEETLTLSHVNMPNITLTTRGLSNTTFPDKTTTVKVPQTDYEPHDLVRKIMLSEEIEHNRELFKFAAILLGEKLE